VKNDSLKISFVSVPRDTLVELLAKAGYVHETPESFLAAGQVGIEVERGNLIQKAARLAHWSRL